MRHLSFAMLIIAILIIIDTSGIRFAKAWPSRNTGDETIATNEDVIPFYGCATSAYPPDDSARVPTYTVDLDLPPELRWVNFIKDKKEQLLALVGHVYNLTESLLGPRVFMIMLNALDELTESLPSPYKEELAGIAATSGLEVGQVTMYNVFYEMFNYCTSIIVQDRSGTLYHARNLDFGLLMGWDSPNHEWKVAELLRPLVAEVSWFKGGRLLFRSVNYAGHVGVITAVKKGVFSFSLNERFSLNGGYVGLLEWILFKDYGQKWLSFLTRDVLEGAQSFQEARYMLATPRLLAPVYFTLAGVLPGEACLITRYRDNYNILPLGDARSPARWFLAQTNYDYWKQPPFYDDRRGPAIKCLLELRNTVESREHVEPRKASQLREASESRNVIEPQFKEVTATTTAEIIDKGETKTVFNNMIEMENLGRTENVEDLLILYGSDQHVAKNESKYAYMHVEYISSEANASFSLLYNVLSTRPVLNKLTTYTTLMSAKEGYMETWLRYCPDPCWPW